ncbi:helix-turn-helix domain-containing protein [Anaerocolumna sp. MB42-C2]|uniref:helix-turn-helix domain-containing protein n=1 Tax=Anaerocolumna sp. MB42-C2 TaxID=3070997 RepID=UPI0027E01C06|nr:helix-turn-helix transcriptional regulator [Anaerocolumna sp. MB42-C2]WMJ85458.1 helix-turn-helix transcriptional regulator [Anaerocolumna sp. MB42-C2]
MSGLGNKEIIARNIRKYMELNNKTRNDICSELGVSYSTFTDWVNGNIYPRIDKIEMLAKYFGIEKADLIEDKKDQSDSVSQDEQDLLAIYRTLSNDDKKMLKRLTTYLNAFNGMTKKAACEYLNQLMNLQKAHDLELRAAHNDFADDEEEQKLIQKDIDEL